MKLPYGEGTWFAVPLCEGQGFAVGVVARMAPEGKVILCYFFGPRRDQVPTLGEVEHLSPEEALRVLRVGDLELIRGNWPVLGHSESWRRDEWPMPCFVRHELLTGRILRVQYSETDPAETIREEPVSSAADELEYDLLYGAGAAEIVLTRELTGANPRTDYRFPSDP